MINEYLDSFIISVTRILLQTFLYIYFAKHMHTIMLDTFLGHGVGPYSTLESTANYFSEVV